MEVESVVSAKMIILQEEEKTVYAEIVLFISFWKNHVFFVIVLRNEPSV